MSGGGGDSAEGEMEVSGQWPFKYLWNTIRGESLVADDEVLLEELRVSYPSLSKALLFFKKSNASGTAGGTSTSAYGTFTTQIANTLDVDESMAKKLFASYVMFEHQGGTISLTADRVTLGKHIGRIRTFYLQERMCLLLSIQALFGGACNPDHQYKDVFKAFTKWLVKDGSITEIIRNLVESVPLCLSVEEELNTMFALTHCLYYDPFKAIQPFLESYKGFNSTSERRDSLVAVAEGGLFFSALLLPIDDEDCDEDPINLLQPVIQSRKVFLRTRLEDQFIANNMFITPAIIAAKYVTEGSDAEASISNPFWVYSGRIGRLVEFYLNNRSFKRHNATNIVLQCVYKAMETSYACCPYDIPQEYAPTFHILMTNLIANVEGNFHRFLNGNPEIQNVYLEATLKFPAILEPLMELWGAIAKSLGKPAEIDEMLSYLGSELSTVAELSAEPLVQGRSETVGYAHNQDQTVASVPVPAGSEIVYFEHLGEKSFLTSWDLKGKLPYSPWRIIAEHLVLPLYKTVTCGMPISSSVLWSEPLIKSNFLALVKFLITFSDTSDGCSDVSQLKLYFHCVTILVRAMDLTRDIAEQSLFGGYVVRLTLASVKLKCDFRRIASWGREYMSKIFPSTPEAQNLVATVVMGIESLGSSGFHVTDSFLDTIIFLLNEDNLENTLACSILNDTMCRSVLFMNDNIFHSFTRWRRMSEEKRHELLLKCLRVYNSVFNVDNAQFVTWNEAKEDCARSLLAPNSSLMVILSTEESALTESVVNPTDVSSYISPIIYQSLSLLLKLFHYQKDAIRLVDEFLGKTLVKKLATFAQHRLDYKIPTLAVAVLKRIAEELNMSLLSCLGRQDTEFRDLLLQRLEFKCEDVNLKVGILEFLAVAAHSQPGLIQFVFMDPILAQKIVDLPTEKDDNLSISVLVFMRAMIHSGVTVLKKCDNLWTNIFCPLKNSPKPVSNYKMVTCFLHICTFEIFHYGLTEDNFVKILKAFLRPEFCEEIIKDGFTRSGVEMESFLVALKQFLRVMQVRHKYSGPVDPIFPEKTKLCILQHSTKAFFEIKESGAEPTEKATHTKSIKDRNDSLRCSVAEIICQLVDQTEFEPDYLDVLMGWLVSNFAEDKVAVQIPVLYVVRGCIEVRPRSNPISDSTLENTLRVVVDSLGRTEKILDHPSFPIPVAIITQSLNVLIAIKRRGTTVCPKWESMFKQYSVSSIVTSIIRSTISRRKAPEVALQAMYLLNNLAEEKDGLFLCNIALSDLIWYPLVVFATPESNADPVWEQVYVLGLELTAKLLRHQRHFFLEDVLNFWGIHGAYLSHKLWSLSEMTKTCVMNDPEKNYTNMRSLLNFNVFVLSTVSSMLPFHEEWRRQQPNEFERILEGSFTALNTAINLLNQPGYLQVVITLGRNSTPNLSSSSSCSNLSSDPRVSPQLLDLQTRLWEVIFLCTDILFKVRLYSGVFFNSETVMGTINQVISTCLKGVSKSHSSTASGQQTSTNAAPASSPISPRIEPTLERAVILFLFHAKKILEIPTLKGRLYNIASREIATDVNTIVDGVKRLSGPKNAYLLAMCEGLEKELASNFAVSRPSRSLSTGVMDES